MAESEGKGILSAFAAFIEKFLNDRSLWLWLLICALGLVFSLRIGWSKGELQAAVTPASITAFAWFSFCMLMNAIRAQDVLTAKVSNLYRALIAGAGSSSNARSTTSGANVGGDASHGGNGPRWRKRRRRS